MNKIINRDNLNIILIEGHKNNENDYIQAIKYAITESSYYTNKFYIIAINNQIIFALINQQGYLHFYIKNIEYAVNKKGHIKYNNTLLKNEYKQLLETVKEDNIYLTNNGQYDTEEVKTA